MPTKSRQRRPSGTARGTPSELTTLTERYGCGPVKFTGTSDALYERHLLFDAVVSPSAAGGRERFEAVARSIRDVLSQRWVATERTYAALQPKRAYYLSMEYLLGRSLANNMTSLLLGDIVRELTARDGLDLVEILDQEPDAGLGNGGLGRLAACVLDAAATLQLPAMGYGLRYDYGLFRQAIEDGWQKEYPDRWLAHPDPWEVARPAERVEVKLNCSFEVRDGSVHPVFGRPSTLVGMPYDRPVVGYGGNTINTLRLWAATAPEVFDFGVFSSGDYIGSMTALLVAETLTRVLYPNDATELGRGLRFVQEYFLVACSLTDLVRRFRSGNEDWAALPSKVAVQINDSHPSLAVAELMRVLLDEARLGWDDAWDLTTRTLAYTNHTVLPEALEQWPLELFQALLPRHLEIIGEIDGRLVRQLRDRFPGDEGRVARTRIIEQGSGKVRMAHLAVIGSHSTNGVAQVHSGLLRSTTLTDLAELYPERFGNVTNGVTQRRWMLLANPRLSSLVTDAIGDGWRTDLAQLRDLAPLAEDRPFLRALCDTKRRAKEDFSAWLRREAGIVVDPETIFDCQVKRIHEYKRQLLNVLRIVALYRRLREDPALDVPPRTFFFAGKAAPAYHLAKTIIKLINNVARTIDGDAAVRGRMKVVFLPNYGCSLAERIIPAADVSNQISTAGFEASGTSNMKFMMNGALTLGTRDGATLEMADEVGEESMFLFGLTAEQVAASASWYSPWWHYQHEEETRAALDLLFSGHFNQYEPGVLEPIRDALLLRGDRFMHLADLRAYLAADAELVSLFAEPMAWSRKALLNIAASGKFSIDRTVSEYAARIWGVTPCPVST